MSTETERKYLVDPELLPPLENGEHIIQAYLQIKKKLTVRVRITSRSAYITVKGAVKGISRPEFEYPVPIEDAFFMAYELSPFEPIRKIRRKIFYKGNNWQLDEFLEQNAGLWIAEIELTSPYDTFELPPWIVREVSKESRYYNSLLARHPYSRWEKE